MHRYMQGKGSGLRAEECMYRYMQVYLYIPPGSTNTEAIFIFLAQSCSMCHIQEAPTLSLSLALSLSLSPKYVEGGLLSSCQLGMLI